MDTNILGSWQNHRANCLHSSTGVATSIDINRDRHTDSAGTDNICVTKIAVWVKTNEACKKYIKIKSIGNIVLNKSGESIICL